MADVKSLKAAFDQMAQRVQADLASLRTQLAQAQSGSKISAEDQATLDQLEQTANALDPTDSTTLADVGTTDSPPASSAPTS